MKYSSSRSFELAPRYVAIPQKPDCCAAACLQMLLYRNIHELFDQEELALALNVKVRALEAFNHSLPLRTHQNFDEGISTVESSELVNDFFRKNAIELVAASVKASAIMDLPDFLKTHLALNHDLWIEYHTDETRQKDSISRIATWPRAFRRMRYGSAIHDGLIESFDPKRGAIVINPSPTYPQRFLMPLDVMERAISGCYGRETGFLVVQRSVPPKGPVSPNVDGFAL